MKKDANYEFEFKVDMESEFGEQLQDAINVHFYYGCTVLGDDRKIRKAVNKQKALPVVLEEGVKFHNLYYSTRVLNVYCPKCHQRIIGILPGRVNKFSKGENTYCNRCGQKLDWSKYD